MAVMFIGLQMKIESLDVVLSLEEKLITQESLAQCTELLWKLICEDFSY